MRYTVTWTRSADQDLAEVWLRSQIEAESRRRRMRLIKPCGTTHMRRAMKYRKAFAELISRHYDSCLLRAKTIASSKLRLFARSDVSRGTLPITRSEGYGIHLGRRVRGLGCMCIGWFAASSSSQWECRKRYADLQFHQFALHMNLNRFIW